MMMLRVQVRLVEVEEGALNLVGEELEEYRLFGMSSRSWRERAHCADGQLWDLWERRSGRQGAETGEQLEEQREHDHHTACYLFYCHLFVHHLR